MIYWLQEVTTAGGQGGGPSWLLSAGVIGATVSLIGLILAQLRHTQTLRQTRQLEDTRRLEARELEDTRRLEARELEAQRASEAALQKYFDQMRGALTDPKRPLRRSTTGDNLSTIARAQTLAVLEGLDPDRKRILLQFLYESHLIVGDNAIISLRGANLQWANLQGAELIKADLVRAELGGANLSNANLEEADLFRTHLDGADLSNAILSRAKLGAAHLAGASFASGRLYGTDLAGAHLNKADLSRAEGLTQEQIDQAFGDEDIKLPDHLRRPKHWIRGEESSEES